MNKESRVLKAHLESTACRGQRDLEADQVKMVPQDPKELMETLAQMEHPEIKDPKAPQVTREQ